MGIDEAQHGRGYRGSQALQQALGSLVVLDHLQLVDDRVPSCSPLLTGHQSSSRRERTHSTWRLIRKPTYTGTLRKA